MILCPNIITINNIRLQFQVQITNMGIDSSFTGVYFRVKSILHFDTIKSIVQVVYEDNIVMWGQTRCIITS